MTFNTEGIAMANSDPHAAWGTQLDGSQAELSRSRPNHANLNDKTKTPTSRDGRHKNKGPTSAPLSSRLPKAPAPHELPSRAHASPLQVGRERKGARAERIFHAKPTPTTRTPSARSHHACHHHALWVQVRKTEDLRRRASNPANFERIKSQSVSDLEDLFGPPSEGGDGGEDGEKSVSQRMPVKGDRRLV